MKVTPSIQAPRPGGRRRISTLRLFAVVAAVCAFLASVMQIKEGLEDEEPQQSVSVTTPPPVVVVTPISPTREDIERAAIEQGATAPVSGSWTLTKVVERSTYNPFVGLRLAYRLNLIEGRAGEVEGTGELWSENGEEVTGLNHLIMKLSGYFDGNVLRLKFEVAGRERPTTGALVLEYDEQASQWHGLFDHSAGASSGPATLEPR